MIVGQVRRQQAVLEILSCAADAAVLEEAAVVLVAAAGSTQHLVLHVAELDLVDVLLAVQFDLLREQDGVDLALPAVRMLAQVLLQGIRGLPREDEAVGVRRAPGSRRGVAELVTCRARRLRDLRDL